MNNVSSGVHGPAALQGLSAFFPFLSLLLFPSFINLQRSSDAAKHRVPLLNFQLQGDARHRRPDAPERPAAGCHGGSGVAPVRFSIPVRGVPAEGGEPTELLPPSHAPPAPSPENESESVAAASQRSSPDPPNPRVAPEGAIRLREGTGDPDTTACRLTHREEQLETAATARSRARSSGGAGGGAGGGAAGGGAAGEGRPPAPPGITDPGRPRPR